MKNKKAIIPNIKIFIVMAFSLFGVLFLGIFAYIFSQFNTFLSTNIDIGAVNLQTINSQTFGAVATAFLNNVDIIAISLLLGLVMFMFITAYFKEEETHTLFIFLDIIILIFAFIFAVYLSNTYETFITSASVLSVFTNNLPKSSTFILNLPVYVGIIGAIGIALTYIKFPDRKEEEQFNIPI